jgi:membrane-associated protease RseP (regulator of RpoE activity)
MNELALSPAELLMFLPVVWLLIAVHELGHVAGCIVTRIPVRVFAVASQKLPCIAFKLYVGRRMTCVYLGPSLSGFINTPKWARHGWRYAVIILGGPVFSLIAALICLWSGSFLWTYAACCVLGSAVIGKNADLRRIARGEGFTKQEAAA